MKTEHKIIFSNANDMKDISSESIDLVVTSPPYPMIEMWDQQFSSINLKIKDALDKKEGTEAFDLMHEELNKVWKEVNRVLKNGGIACINIGDATRTIGDSFQMFSNHSRIIHNFQQLGVSVLPSIIWRKQTNKPNKYMGSGMLPAGAYVTLEHEYILIFRKGKSEKPNPQRKMVRQNSAYFWEERNLWFSDIWMDLKGITQKLNHAKLRERSGAYPFELAYRLINMHSLIGDTVLDPFLGTGTTTLASILCCRNSVGYEIENNFDKTIRTRIGEIKERARGLIVDRLNTHINFIEKRKSEGKETKYKSNKYGFPVVTRQEINIVFPIIEKISRINKNEIVVHYNENNPLKSII